MAYPRRRTRRSTMRRRRPMRRRMRVPRRLPRKALLVQHFKRTYEGPVITSSSAADTFGGLSFVFSSLPNATDFTNLYDRYRINKILIRFLPNFTEAQQGSVQLSNFFTVIDYNDAAAPASINALLEYPNCKFNQQNRMHKRIFSPATLDATSTTGAITATNPVWRQWISTTSTDVPHFGLKYCQQRTTVGGDISYRTYVTYYFSCAGVR